ncbi:MAG: T9SS type A sorting domain-containing protein [Cytophagaceae bacterium]|nr:T9SS type A sorting domain-containing protein [Cytophagaceae bacterium]
MVSSSTSQLGKIDLSSDAISASSYTNTIYSTASSGPMNFGLYRLPDQVDGENYYSFRGVDVAVISANTINGQANANPSWNSFYNCVAINQSVTATGSQGRIILTKVDASKNPIVGGGAYSATTTWSTIASLSADLRTFSGTSNELQNNNGYYKLEVQVKNSCDVITSVIWWLQINAAPTAASITLTLNDYATVGVPDAPVQTAPGLALGIYSGSFNLNNSTGTVTFWQIQIDEVTNTGAFVRTILPTATFNVSGVSGLTAVNFNTLNIPAIGAPVNWAGGTGFFANKAFGFYYKMTMTVGNDCGSSSNWSYVKYDCFCKMGQFIASNDNGKFVTTYPNPFDRQLTVNVPDGDIVKFSIINPLGSVLYEREFSGSETTGGVVQVETAELPRGAYIYKMEANGESVTGQIIK